MNSYLSFSSKSLFAAKIFLSPRWSIRVHVWIYEQWKWFHPSPFTLYPSLSLSFFVSLFINLIFTVHSCMVHVMHEHLKNLIRHSTLTAFKQWMIWFCLIEMSIVDSCQHKFETIQNVNLLQLHSITLVHDWNA